MAKPTGTIGAPDGCTDAISAGDVTAKPQWREDFLVALAELSNVTAASAAAGVKPSRAYNSKRIEPEFAKQWREALCEGYDNLELELLQRLRFGETKDGDAKFDNANALRLLTHHRETVARQRAIRGNEDVAQVRASIHAKLLELRDQVLARRKAEQESADASHG